MGEPGEEFGNPLVVVGEGGGCAPAVFAYGIDVHGNRDSVGIEGVEIVNGIAWGHEAVVG